MADIISFISYAEQKKICIAQAQEPKKKRKHSRIKPKKQGDLDGLCGVYSVVNAMRAVCKKQLDKEQLFKYLLHTLDKDTPIKKAILAGTYKTHIDHMLETATTYVGRRHGMKIAVEPLFKRRGDLELADYWETLQTFLRQSKRRCVIIGYHGRHDHWTVVHEVTHDALKLLDSDGSKQIRRRKCQIGKPYSEKSYHLMPTQVWGISLNK